MHSHLPTLTRWNLIRDLKEERKKALYTCGWKAFQTEGSVCDKGLDSGKLVRLECSERGEQRWTQRDRQSWITQGLSGHGTQFLFYSDCDKKPLEGSEHRSDILWLKLLMTCWLLCTRQRSQEQEQKQGEPSGGHCTNVHRKWFALRRWYIVIYIL